MQHQAQTSRRTFLLGTLLSALGASSCRGSSSLASIKVGVLHSFTGTMGLSEKPVAEATLLAIKEINQLGGILERRVEPITVDARSDDDLFAKEAERLITQDRVVTLFGCWTSSSRKRVKEVVEKHNHLLFYPVQYEGLEESPNIVYTGALPNQQIVPAVKWSYDNLGTKYFLVGSDYVFPRTANAIISEGKVSMLEVKAGPPLGIIPDGQYETEHTQFRKGDTLLLYTDGITEAANLAEGFFFEEGAEAYLQTAVSLGMKEIVDGLVGAVRKFAAEAPQSGDMTVLAARYLG